MSVVDAAQMSEVCSLCDAVETGPYCPVHGAVHRGFSISGRYDIESLLAASAAAFVFGAQDRTTARAVAIKILRSEKADSPWCAATPAPRPPLRESQREFQRAAATLSELPVAHAAEILNVGRDDDLGVTYVVIDRLDLGADGTGASAWSNDAIGDALVTATVGKAGSGDSGVLDALEAMALPDMIGSYRVVRELGAGATGRVYLGEHPVIGSKVAIKVLLPDIARQTETVRRFLQEARASSQIGSPLIPRYHDFGTTLTGQPYAVMEYFEGETLGKRLARNGVMSVEDTAQIIDQVAGALQMAHDAGLIHRDLKPENLMLIEPAAVPGRLGASQTASMTAQPGAAPIEVKLLDFGIAKVVGRRAAAQTQNGAFLGTPFYCAPEQVFGLDVDARTDVYSLGATAFEMLTGAPPFTGEVPEILSAKATEDPPDPRRFGVPDVVAETIRMMLARDPRERAPSMAWVRAQVARWSRRTAALPPLEHSETAEMPAARPPDESTRLGRADTAIPDAGASELALDERAALPSAPRRSRVWLGLGAGAIAAIAAAVMLVVSPFHRAVVRTAGSQPGSAQARPIEAPAGGVLPVESPGAVPTQAAAIATVPVEAPPAPPPPVVPVVPVAPAGSPVAAGSAVPQPAAPAPEGVDSARHPRQPETAAVHAPRQRPPGASQPKKIIKRAGSSEAKPAAVGGGDVIIVDPMAGGR